MDRMCHTQPQAGMGEAGQPNPPVGHVKGACMDSPQGALASFPCQNQAPQWGRVPPLWLHRDFMESAQDPKDESKHIFLFTGADDP